MEPARCAQGTVRAAGGIDIRGRWIAGVLVALAGVIWFLQGVGLVRGSFMTGSTLWMLIGAGCVVIGVAVAVTGRRRGPGNR